MNGVLTSGLLPAGGARRVVVALTQDAAGAADWHQMLAAAGMDTRAWPAFDVVAEPDAAVLRVLGQETMAAAQAAEAPLCVVLPSPAAVRLLAAALQRAGRPWPAGVWAAVPGAGSARVFRMLIDPCDVLLVPPPPGQDAAHLAQMLLDGAVRPAEVRVLCRPDGRRDWAGSLRAAGVPVSFWPGYRVVMRSQPPAGFGETLHAVAADREQVALHWLAGSAGGLQTVAGWLASVPADLRGWARSQPVWVPHERLLPVACAAGFASTRVYHDRQQLVERLQSENL